MSILIKRTLMMENQELLDFEVEPVTGEAHILNAPGENDELLTSFGLVGPDLDTALTSLVRDRCLSSNRVDLTEILEAFGTRSTIELAFRGHGLSLTDKFWYRTPGSTECWEDINFLDNDWDASFQTSVLTRNYSGLASCSPDVPDITTRGHLRKTWERNDKGIFLLKEPLREDGIDLEGALLSAQLSALLFGQDTYQPLNIVRRYGRRLSASPLMIMRDEEFVQGRRLFTMCGIQPYDMDEYMGVASPQTLIDVFSRAGMTDASAQAAKTFTFKSLSLLADLHTGNYGMIRNVKTDERQAVPPFDYDRSFGFPREGFPLENMCANPEVAMLLCAHSFSDLDPLWDWSWYDPRTLDSFEEYIVEAYSPYHELPTNFGELVASLFVMQRDYVNEVAKHSKNRDAADKNTAKS